MPNAIQMEANYTIDKEKLSVLAASSAILLTLYFSFSFFIDCKQFFSRVVYTYICVNVKPLLCCIKHYIQAAWLTN